MVCAMMPCSTAHLKRMPLVRLVLSAMIPRSVDNPEQVLAVGYTKSKKMSNGEHEIRTPKGLRIGNRSVVDGKNMLQIKRGGCEDYISAESLVESIHGLPVKSIEFFTAENRRKEA